MKLESWNQGRALPAPELRRAVVRRVLAVADDLERRLPAAGPGPGRRLVVEGDAGCVELGRRDRLLLGRAPGCDLVLGGPGVSRAHLAIFRRAGELWAEDLGSRNGTWAGGERVALRRLADGDVLRLAGAPIRIHIW